MKDDLIKILNYKLKQIRDNIDSLNSLNDKINKKNDELNFIRDAIKNFEGKEQGFDIYKFSNIDRETFNKLLMNLSSDVLTKFGTDSCNYDGLIYLINGINSGISLTLTQEQIDAINLFIDKLLEKEKDFQDVIVSLNEEKQKLDIKDLEILKELENKYSLIIENIEDRKYVIEIDEVVDAINYSNLSSENAFEILCYLLKYNSKIYNEKLQEISKERKKDSAINLTKPFEEQKNSAEASIDENSNDDEIQNTIDLSLNKEKSKINDEDDKSDETFEMTNVDENEEKINVGLSFDTVEPEISDESDEQNNSLEISLEEKKEDDDDKINVDLSLENVENENSVEETINSFEKTLVDEKEDNEDKIEFDIKNDVDANVDEIEYNPILPSLEKEGYFNKVDLDVSSFDEFSGQKIDVVLPTVDLDLPIDDEFNKFDINDNEEKNIVFDTVDESKVELPELNSDENEESSNVTIDENDLEISINEDNADESVTNSSVELGNIENDLNVTININSDELKNTFENYGIDYQEIDDITKSLLLKGNIDEYRNIIDKLEELKVYKYFKNNLNVLIQMFLYSNTSIIDKVMEIVKKDLSVDEEDKIMTFDIICKTMPTVFINGENGNYDNFVKNVDLLKEYGIDLINLFDFSREVLIADNKLIINNYEIVSTYDLTVNAYNAKYLLLLPDINGKIDHYVESIYKDNSSEGNNQVFDGIEMIKLYPNKLNTVNSETIKRLRFASENGLKIFGSKEKSLTSEITNLNINRIEMTDNYLKSLFNNEFDIIARDEFYKYVSLIKTSGYIELVEDSLLKKLDVYKNGLRYFIGNINISINKVIRNYNILINNGVENKKALLFALCYNLVISKTEYEKIKSFVDNLGGN